MALRLFLFAAVLTGIFVLGCSDGKLTLVLTLWIDHEEESSSSIEYIPSSSPSLPSSSSSIIFYSSEGISSSSEEISSSSNEEISSSSEEELPSSSSFSSSSIPSSSSKDYPDYPTLEEGSPNVRTGKITRYWDGCKQSCSRYEHAAAETDPFVQCRTCDITGIKEYPYVYKDAASDGQYFNRYGTTPSACGDGTYNEWIVSPTYQQWLSENPNIRPGMALWEDAGHACFDQAPYAVNDTLSYAFAAGPGGACGKCFRLQFTGEASEQTTKPTHKALKGKTLIVIVANRGTGTPGFVNDQHFDLMVPGGGLGDFDAFSRQIGIEQDDPQKKLGHRTGGLLSSCIFDGPENGGLPSTGDRSTLEDFQNCLRTKCDAAFGHLKSNPGTLPLWRGCMWMAEWFMAADNPEYFYSETPCPKYLLDKFVSEESVKKPDMDSGDCGLFMLPDGESEAVPCADWNQ
ncbi:MAG: hypothetical protein LBB36_06660 [Fibromonadaceae bacterium]|nr:hypothetical protein [Fibromonadaceae bacterium]